MKIDKDSMYELIKCWEYDNGEGFTDYFNRKTNININNLMFWALGKGIINKEKFDIFSRSRCNSLSYVLFADYDFSIIKWKDDTSDEDYYKLEDESLKILAEFLCSSDVYISRVALFVAGYGWSTRWEKIEEETDQEKVERGIRIFKEVLKAYNNGNGNKIKIEW